MSQPLISRSYTPPSASETTLHSHQKHLHGPNGTTHHLSSNPPSSSSSSPSSSSASTSNAESSSSAQSSSFRTPPRLTSASFTSSLSAPTLSKPHVSAQTAASSSPQKCTSPSLHASSSAHTTHPISSNKCSSRVPATIPHSSIVVSSSLPSPGVETENDIAVTSQPPGPCLTGPGKPSGTAESSPPQQGSTTSAHINQAPTIAQRDALTSRVYSMCRSGGYTNWLHLLELSPLASQHHLSSYNCMKFGNQGACLGRQLNSHGYP